MHGSLAYSSQSLASDGALFRVAVDLGGGGGMVAHCELLESLSNIQSKLLYFNQGKDSAGAALLLLLGFAVVQVPA